MYITYTDETKFHETMRGNYNLEDVIDYINKHFSPDEIFTELELREWFGDND